MISITQNIAVETFYGSSGYSVFGGGAIIRRGAGSTKLTTNHTSFTGTVQIDEGTFTVGVHYPFNPASK